MCCVAHVVTCVRGMLESINLIITESDDHRFALLIGSFPLRNPAHACVVLVLCVNLNTSG